MCKAYDARLADARAILGEAALEKEKALQSQRFRMWIQRKCDNEGNPCWRPAKRYRVASRTWQQNLDNQIRFTLGLPGLVSFVPAEETGGAASDWRTMRHLLISCDQGGDNLCAVNFLRHIKANITFLADWSHGANNDFHDAVRDMGLFKFWLLAMILLNMEHGPWGEHVRWAQCSEAWQELRAHSGAKTCPLYLEYSGRIVREMMQKGVLEVKPGEDAEIAAWRALESEAPCLRKGAKTNLARFRAGRRAAALLIEKWMSKRFV